MRALLLASLLVTACTTNQPSDPDAAEPGADAGIDAELDAAPDAAIDAPDVPVCWMQRHVTCPDPDGRSYDLCVPYAGCAYYQCVTDPIGGGGVTMAYCGPGAVDAGM